MDNENPRHKKTHVIGGGTVYHVRSHLALSAQAYGTTARKIADICKRYDPSSEVVLHLTKMASQGKGMLDTNSDVADLIKDLVGDTSTKTIYFSPALIDYSGHIMEKEIETSSGKYATRLQTDVDDKPAIVLHASPKILGTIRKERKDIYLVGFKTTCNASQDEQYLRGLDLLKKTSANLILANDVYTRVNMIIAPEETRYHVTKNREDALENLVDMALQRSKLRFTRSTVVPGSPVSWDSPLVPSSLRAVVNYCIAKGAYKQFNGATAGHFAVKVDDKTFLTSRRKTDYNYLSKMGLVRVEARGPDEVIAYGSKPSVGGQSQRIVFEEHQGYDCIVHFHCPIKESSLVPRASQREYECGSHECGQNTSRGLQRFGNLKAVYLDNHGPNIVFPASVDPGEVISFIEKNFDLGQKTGGLFHDRASASGVL
ncbi:MAG TPA: class II aldolase/adducin family protein [Candidatus Nanoarchaeia archaeon]|nr:class II aldolase/adducin family protein [Candidatus Nanoarchaeia archaeon]